MRRRQLDEQLRRERRVDAVPQLAAGARDIAEVLGCGRARGRAPELRGDGWGERGREGAEDVDRARDAAEGDAFQADFADELGVGDVGCGGYGRGGGGGDGVQYAEGFGGVER